MNEAEAKTLAQVSTLFPAQTKENTECENQSF
jgi:hypothetical protein